METYVITAIMSGASTLKRKLERHGYYNVRVYQKTNVIATGESQPWAILAGYNSHATQVVPVGEHPTTDRIDDAVSKYGI